MTPIISLENFLSMMTLLMIGVKGQNSQMQVKKLQNYGEKLLMKISESEVRRFRTQGNKIESNFKYSLKIS